MSHEPEESLRLAFQQSWDAIEEFYREALLSKTHWHWLRPILVLLSELRAEGYDQVLRAGQSLHRLGLSRSRKHGLREGQPSVWIEPYPDGTMEVATVVQGRHMQSQKLPQTHLCTELTDVLENLRRKPID